MTKQVDLFPEETLKSNSFIVKGHIVGQGDVTRYYLAEDEMSVDMDIKATPVEDGGFSSYSIEEVDALPDDAFIACPSCDHKFQDKHRVLTVG